MTPGGGCLKAILLDPLRLFLGNRAEQRRRFFRLARLKERESLRKLLITRLRAFLRSRDRFCDLLLLPGKRVRSAGDEQGSQFVYLAFKLLLALLFARAFDEAAVAPIKKTDHPAKRRDRAKPCPQQSPAAAISDPGTQG